MLKLFKGIFSKKLSKPKALVGNEAVVELKEEPQLLEQDHNLAVYITDITHNSVSVIAIGGNGSGDYIYGKSPSNLLTNISFQASPVFSGLNPETTYFFSARKKGDETYSESRISGRKSVATYEAPVIENPHVKIMKTIA